MFEGRGYGISIDHKQIGSQMKFKTKSWLRTGLGVGVQLISIFVLEIVVVIISTIGEMKSIGQRRSEIWKAYKQGRPVDLE
jgi:hypothetical protein